VLVLEGNSGSYLVPKEFLHKINGHRICSDLLE
jgi:hypothetical protein